MKIILIVIDTLRYKNLGFNGYKPEYSDNKNSPSPYLDKLANDGVVFDNFFTNINCTHPSFTTILSGRYPISHTIISHISPHEIIDNVIMLPEILRDNGINTVAIDNLGRWFVKGFQDYLNPLGPNGMLSVFTIPGGKVTDKAIEWLDLNGNTNDDFFMMIHYWDPHVPYSPPRKYRQLYYSDDPKNPSKSDYPKMDDIPKEKFDLIFRAFQRQWDRVKDVNYFLSQYDSCIKYMDDEINRLFKYLEEKNILEDTLIIFTSDHGESLSENDIYFTHVHLYDQMMHIPLFFWNPKLFPNPSRRNAMIANVDITPTILDLYGIKIPSYIEGNSFLPVLKGSDKHRDKIYMFEHEAISRRGVRTNKWKFIKNAKEEDDAVGSRLQALGYISIVIEATAKKELYDLENDPSEINNLIDKYPEIAEELENDLENFVSETCKRIGIEDPQQEQDLEPWDEFDDPDKWQMTLIKRNNEFKIYDK